MKKQRHILGNLLDIYAPEEGVQVEIRADGKVLWVSVDGSTALRICKIPQIDVVDRRLGKHETSASRSNAD